MKIKFLVDKKKALRAFSKWNILAIIVFAILIFASFIFILKGPARSKPNIVIICIDTLRADHCSLYGYQRNTTPNIDHIAGQGLTLSGHYANAPWTKPSTASMITGLYPTAHGSRIGQFEEIEIQISPVVEVLAPEVETMAEILQKNGYHTHAFITNYHLTPDFGYAQGYEQYNFDPEGSNRDKVCLKDKQMLESTVNLLENRESKAKPLFIWCHLMGVHAYESPDTFQKFKSPDHPSTPIPANAEQVEVVKDYHSIESVVDAYDNSIAYVDSIVGEFYRSLLEKCPNTLIIITSDHGEEFFEHGGFEHARTLYNEILKVPCVIWGPGVPKDIFDGVSDSLDLVPTILKNIGIEPDSRFRGQAIFYKNKIVAQYSKEIFAEQHHRGSCVRFALIKNGWKMIQNVEKCIKCKSFELYKDPFSIETQNVYSEADSKISDQLKRKIGRYQKITQQYFKENVGSLQYKNLNKKDIQHLRTLGYIH